WSSDVCSSDLMPSAGAGEPSPRCLSSGGRRPGSASVSGFLRDADQGQSQRRAQDAIELLQPGHQPGDALDLLLVERAREILPPLQDARLDEIRQHAGEVHVMATKHAEPCGFDGGAEGPAAVSAKMPGGLVHGTVERLQSRYLDVELSARWQSFVELRQYTPVVLQMLEYVQREDALGAERCNRVDA